MPLDRDINLMWDVFVWNREQDALIRASAGMHEIEHEETASRLEILRNVRDHALFVRTECNNERGRFADGAQRLARSIQPRQTTALQTRVRERPVSDTE